MDLASGVQASVGSGAIRGDGVSIDWRFVGETKRGVNGDARGWDPAPMQAVLWAVGIARIVYRRLKTPGGVIEVTVGETARRLRVYRGVVEAVDRQRVGVTGGTGAPALSRIRAFLAAMIFAEK